MHPQTRRPNGAAHPTAGPDLDARGGGQLALDRAGNDDLVGVNVTDERARLPDLETASSLDGAGHAAVDAGTAVEGDGALEDEPGRHERLHGLAGARAAAR